MNKKEIVISTKKFGYITGFISGKKKVLKSESSFPVEQKDVYDYTMIDHNGNQYILGTFTAEQLAKVKRIEEDLTYDYSMLI